MDTEVVDAERLKFFTPFQPLSDKQLDYIAVNAEIINVKSGKMILDLESSSPDKYLLLEGTLKLLSFDNSTTRIEANTDRARNPVAQLRPSRYKVSTDSLCKILVLKEDVLDTAIERVDVPDAYCIDETELDDEHEEDRILYELILDLQQGNFVLPSLPSVATRIRETIEDEKSNAVDIANVILADPAIAVKVIKAANSAMYQRRTKALDCKAAVVGLGTKVTTQLVLAFTLKELFNPKSELLKKRMTQLWEHSIEIAAISFVLAKISPGFDAEHALLAGLIHGIGDVAIINKISEQPQIMDNEEKLDEVINKMRTQVAASILKRWNFAEDFIAVAEGTGDWMRDNNSEPDLVDIVNMAHLHSYIGTPKQRTAPIIDQVPAFNKMALGQLTPKLSIKVLEKAREKIDQTKALLRI